MREKNTYKLSACMDVRRINPLKFIDTSIYHCLNMFHFKCYINIYSIKIIFIAWYELNCIERETYSPCEELTMQNKIASLTPLTPHTRRSSVGSSGSDGCGEIRDEVIKNGRRMPFSSIKNGK